MYFITFFFLFYSLHQVSVPIVSNDRCKSMFLRAGRHEFIPDIFLCAGHDLGYVDSNSGNFVYLGNVKLIFCDRIIVNCFQYFLLPSSCSLCFLYVSLFSFFVLHRKFDSCQGDLIISFFLLFSFQQTFHYI